MLRHVATASALIVALSTSYGYAQSNQAEILKAIPQDAVTVTHWYKQNVYDPSDNKIGEVMDVLLDKQGRSQALIIGVGGFLGIGEKDVAVPFNAVQFK